MTDLDIPWVEKYRPVSLQDIVSHSEIVESLSHFIDKQAIPHLIFTGPAGTGKTSTALALARDYLDKDFSAANILEMNASDSVRMGTIRTVLKQFIGQDSLMNDRLKFAILDEADNIPKTVQQALRRMIEMSSRRVRFILLCNYPDRIIDPILSRCAVFRFPPLPQSLIIEKLKDIAQREGIEIGEEILKYIHKISRGDLRKAINILQMAVTFRGERKLELSELLEVAGFVRNKLIRGLIGYMKENQFRKARRLFKSIASRSSPRNFLFQLLDALAGENLTELQLASVLRVVGRYDFRFTQESGDLLQYDAFLADLMNVLNTSNEGGQTRG